jgi:DNA polymerase-3 subunit delta
VYLFLGPEAYQREICRKALVERVLSPDELETGLVRHDLDETTLAEVLDDACSLSLFAPRRVIWVSSAESALPRGRALTTAADSEGNEGKDSLAGMLAEYMRRPTPEVVIVFQAGRFDFEGDDKSRMERVRRFYSAVSAVVEFPRMSSAAARQLGGTIAESAGLDLTSDDLDVLVEALGADPSRLATEIEKLRLFSGGRRISREDIAALVPDARSASIFALVNAIARGENSNALQALDTLVREGEYLPLTLSFLGTQFRLALAAAEAGVHGTSQIQGFFSRTGIPMWRARAEQVSETISAFPLPRLRAAVRLVHAADRALRDARPDDRIILEDFVLELTR